MRFLPFSKRAPFANILVAVTPTTLNTARDSSTHASQLYSSFTTPISEFLSKNYLLTQPSNPRINALNIDRSSISDLLAIDSLSADIKQSSTDKTPPKGGRADNGFILDRILVFDSPSQTKII